MQSGFGKFYSIVTSLLHVTDKWWKNVDKGLVTGFFFFIDLRKAIDTVNIPILMKKLPMFGVTGL